ncbi:MAG: hypothetical protein RLZZ361_540 [Cyanobacteriota bacterium]
MVINIQFQNISQANSEILKAFNSANSARALEAYQPLDAKERKLEKLRALQILKQSSNSPTLADISLTTTTLSTALQNAEGATLQALLNLLSAKMIEQNKYTYFNEEDRKKLRAKVQQKLDQHQEKNQENPDQKQDQDEDSAIDKLAKAAQSYFEDIYNDLIEKYKKVLSAVSLENLRKAFAESLKTILRLAYETPIEAFREFVIEPIEDFRASLKTKLDELSLQGLQKSKSKKSFSAGEIKSMLQKSIVSSKALKETDETKLLSAISTMDTALKMQKSITQARKKFGSKTELKLALHQ